MLTAVQFLNFALNKINQITGAVAIILNPVYPVSICNKCYHSILTKYVVQRFELNHIDKFLITRNLFAAMYGGVYKREDPNIP